MTIQKIHNDLSFNYSKTYRDANAKAKEMYAEIIAIQEQQVENVRDIELLEESVIAYEGDLLLKVALELKAALIKDAKLERAASDKAIDRLNFCIAAEEAEAALAQKEIDDTFYRLQYGGMDMTAFRWFIDHRKNTLDQAIAYHTDKAASYRYQLEEESHE